MAAGTGAVTRAPRSRQRSGSVGTVGHGAIHGIERSARRVADRIGKGERHLPYTILAILGIALLGAVVVPLSIPEPLAELPREQVLAEQFLLAFAAPGSATVTAGVTAPKLDEVTKAYGTDGGTACTGTLGDSYETLVTRNPGGRVAFDKGGFAQMKVAQSVYCPDRAQPFAKFVQRRAALNARAARAAT